MPQACSYRTLLLNLHVCFDYCSDVALVIMWNTFYADAVTNSIILYIFVTLHMLLINSKNNVGPKTDPSGTLQVIILLSEHVPFIFTY